jgi:dihydroanticapsin dehydrogenase
MRHVRTSGLERQPAAELLAAEGVAVAAVDVEPGPVSKVSSRVQSAGGESIALVADIGSEQDVKAAVEETIGRFEKIDILVNAAAAFVREGVDATAQHWREVLEVNVVGTALLCRQVSRVMRLRRAGSIINIGSISGLVGQSNYATYNASKAAIVSLTQCLAVDLGAQGIRVNCVSPGATDTRGA